MMYDTQHFTLGQLAGEKALYERHPENATLQHKELKSVAQAVLHTAAEMPQNELIEAEKTLIQWAKNMVHSED